MWAGACERRGIIQMERVADMPVRWGEGVSGGSWGVGRMGGEGNGMGVGGRTS